MKNFLALTRRELGVYFVSPMAYIILTVMLLLAGWLFVTSIAFFASNQLAVDYSPTLAAIMVIVVVVVGTFMWSVMGICGG